MSFFPQPPVPVHVKRYPHAVGLPELVYQSEGAAGFDLAAAIPEDHTYLLGVGQRVTVPTGFAFAVPPGFQLEIRTRSGLGFNAGLVITNAPGTIDSDYRGEVMLSVLYASNAQLVDNPEHVPGNPLFPPRRAATSMAFTVKRGQRLAQAVLMPVFHAQLLEIPHDQDLKPSARGSAGFGSTGVA